MDVILPLHTAHHPTPYNVFHTAYNSSNNAQPLSSMYSTNSNNKLSTHYTHTNNNTLPVHSNSNNTHHYPPLPRGTFYLATIGGCVARALGIKTWRRLILFANAAIVTAIVIVTIVYLLVWGSLRAVHYHSYAPTQNYQAAAMYSNEEIQRYESVSAFESAAEGSIPLTWRRQSAHLAYLHHQLD
eukprot:TRINITY_DN4865_c0_g1_i1.p1 TRINITY_DN4865_c0_g1~~TRINITY_DN4865_c0_g1_i1.p1  ORF type:complete len:185 (+),score=46.56 TRINITY_DN4865_c0_g1_i1:139-693(+)